MSTIAMTPVEKSSNVKEVGYDPDLQILAVRYHGNLSLYHYRAVPPHVFADLQADESKGSFIAKQVKPYFPCDRIVERVEA